MKVVFFLLCNLILCSLGAQEQRGFPKDLVQNPSVIEKKMKEAVAHFDAGRYEQSLRLLNESIEKNQHEELKDILYYYIDIYGKSKNASIAMKSCSESTKS